MTTKPQQSWLITINNPTDDDKELLSQLGVVGKATDEVVQYVKWALETGEGETPHIQAYIYLHSPQRFSWIQKRLKRAAIYPTVGTPSQCRDYIGNPDYVHAESTSDAKKAGKRKGGTSEPAQEWGNLDGVNLNKGTRPPKLKRDDVLLMVKDRIDNSATEAELWQEFFPVMVIHGSKIMNYYAIKGLETERDKVVKKYQEVRYERLAIEDLQQQEAKDIALVLAQLQQEGI